MGAGFDKAAKRAVEQFKFSPAEIDGEPGAVRIRYRYVFSKKVVEKKAASPVTQKQDGKVVETGRLTGVLKERGTQRHWSALKSKFQREKPPSLTRRVGLLKVFRSASEG